MSEEKDSNQEIERLKSELLFEQVRSKNQADRDKWNFELQQNKNSDILAIVLVLLFCSIVIILGLTINWL